MDEMQEETARLQAETNRVQTETNRTQIANSIILLIIGFILGLLAANIL